MEDIIKEYSNGEISVIWQPSKCIHSTKCWKSLSEVFNPRVKPWINMTAAETSRIAEQVKQCPSKALSLKENSMTDEIKKDEIEVPVGSITEVVVIRNGPLMIKGDLSIKHKDGQVESHKEVYLCRCGQSGNKPFCDGMHKKCGFKDE